MVRKEKDPDYRGTIGPSGPCHPVLCHPIPVLSDGACIGVMAAPPSCEGEGRAAALGPALVTQDPSEVVDRAMGLPVGAA